MDEAETREEEYYRYLEKKGMFSIILVAAIFAIFLPMMWDPIGYLGSMTDMYLLTVIFILSLLFMLYNRRKLDKYGFWLDYIKETEAADRVFLYLSVLVVIAGLLFSYIYYITFYLRFHMAFTYFLERLLMIFGLVFLVGPYLYLARKKRLQWIKEKYGRNRAIYITGKLDEWKKIVEDSLASLGIKYTEQDESSKLKGHRKFFELSNTSMKIFYLAYDLPSNMVLIANIPDNDTLERQIEKEILRRLQSSG